MDDMPQVLIVVLDKDLKTSEIQAHIDRLRATSGVESVKTWERFMADGLPEVHGR